MAAPVQTFLLDTHYPVQRRILAPTLRSGVGGGARQVRRQWRRPIYEFTIRDSHAIKSAAEYIYSFAQYHLGDVPFIWSGNTWGVVSTPILFGFGDGVQTQFFLNNRRITTDSLSLVGGVNNEITLPDLTVETNHAPNGFIEFETAPDAAVPLKAMYQCTYLVTFQNADEVLMSEELVYNALFSYTGIVLREVVP